MGRSKTSKTPLTESQQDENADSQATMPWLLNLESLATGLFATLVIWSFLDPVDATSVFEGQALAQNLGTRPSDLGLLTLEYIHSRSRKQSAPWMVWILAGYLHCELSLLQRHAREKTEHQDGDSRPAADRLDSLVLARALSSVRCIPGNTRRL